MTGSLKQQQQQQLSQGRQHMWDCRNYCTVAPLSVSIGYSMPSCLARRLRHDTRQACAHTAHSALEDAGSMQEQRGRDEWDQFSMNDLVEAGINDHLQAVDRIAQTAAQELQLELQLAAMDSAWADVRVMVTLQPGSSAADGPSAMPGDEGTAGDGMLRLGQTVSIQVCAGSRKCQTCRWCEAALLTRCMV